MSGLELDLFDYFRSTASYRVRIALNLKGLQATRYSIDLKKAEHRSNCYRKVNPQRLVPALRTSQGVLSQSLAIIEFLNEKYPKPPLLPKNLWHRALCRSQAYTIACDIHPLNNLRVLNYQKEAFQAGKDDVKAWISHWISMGLETLESSAGTARFLSGDTPMLGDILLVPQMYSAKRFGVSLMGYPRLTEIEAACMQLAEFQTARP